MHYCPTVRATGAFPTDSWGNHFCMKFHSPRPSYVPWVYATHARMAEACNQGSPWDVVIPKALASMFLLVLIGLVSNDDAIAQKLTSSNCGGTISDAKGRPLAGVDVVARDGDGRVVAQTTTNARGRYCLTDLLPGGYSFLEIPGNNLRSEIIDRVLPDEGLRLNWTVYADSARATVASPPITSCCKQFLDGLDVVTANISGNMMDRNGTPLVGVEIIAKDPKGTIVGRTVTNTAGRYCLTDLLPGLYTLTESPGKAPIEGETVVANLPAGGLVVDWTVAANNAIAVAISPGVASCCQLFLAGVIPSPTAVAGGGIPPGGATIPATAIAIGAVGLGAGPAILSATKSASPNTVVSPSQ